MGIDSTIVGLSQLVPNHSWSYPVCSVNTAIFFGRPHQFYSHLSNIAYISYLKILCFLVELPVLVGWILLSCWRNPNLLLLPSWFHLHLCFFQPTFCWLKFKFLLVSPCFTMFHNVSPCFTMFHLHISDCDISLQSPFLRVFGSQQPIQPIQPIHRPRVVTCIRMSARSAGLPINAARPPALKAQPAFSKKDICFPGVFTLEGRINGLV